MESHAVRYRRRARENTVRTAFPHAEQIVGALNVRPAVLRLVESGGTVDASLARLGIGKNAELGIAGHVVGSVVNEIWEIASHVLGEVDFGLVTAEYFAPIGFGPISHLALTSQTLGESLARLVEHSRLCAYASSLVVEQEGGTVFLVVEDDLPGTGVARQRCEFIIASYFLHARNCLRTFEPHDVFFRHQRPLHVGSHQKLFGIRPRFGQSANGLSFPAGVMDSRLQTADQTVGAALEALIGQATLHCGTGDNDRGLDENIRAQVRRLVFATGDKRKLSRRLVAAELRTSVRSLQRQLQKERTCLRDILDEALVEVAQRRLAKPGMTASGTALELGFSEPGFHRAFRRWTGMTPGQYKRLMGR